MHCVSVWPNAVTLLDSSFMRLTNLISWVLICGTFAFVSPASGAEPVARVAGRIVAVKVVGKVVAKNLADGTERNLFDNDVLGRQYTVSTGDDAKVVLVFSNGAMLNLGARSTLSIDEFLQDPFPQKIPLEGLQEEPSTSVTRLNLARGELVGKVKKLRQDNGSSFIVKTPVGAAGIRGTTFRILFRPDATGRVVFTLSTDEGDVVFEAPDNAAVSVVTGMEIAVDVEVSIDVTTGVVRITAPIIMSAPREIPAATRVIIAAAAQTIVELSTDVILSINSAPGATNDTEPQSPNGQTAPNGEKTVPPVGDAKLPLPLTPLENTLPVIIAPSPDVTPGAGG